MENLVRKIRENNIACEPRLVVCDHPNAPAIEKAKRLGVEVTLVDRKKFSSKEDFEREIIRELEANGIDLIALAGFMRILSPSFVRRYEGKMVNIHPSLLPAFPGAHAIRDAFEAKVKETGVTVHFVDAGVDTGPVILRKKIDVSPQDTLEGLETKIHGVEYDLYPEALRRIVAGEIKLPEHHRGEEFWAND